MTIAKYINFIKKCKTYLDNFFEPDMVRYASSLSFHTILSIVPVLLIAFTIFTKTPNFENFYISIENFLFSLLAPGNQQMVANYLQGFIKNSANLGALGSIFIIYTSIMFFIDYERITSKIFDTKPRKVWEYITTYWAIVTLLPIGFGTFVYLSTYIRNILSEHNYTILLSMLVAVPYLIVWLIYLIVYIISSEPKVNLKYALISSFLASTVWYITKNIFIIYVRENKSYTTLYGSFSSIMFFLLWVYISWLIFLYGLKLYAMLSKSKFSSPSNNLNNSSFSNKQ